MKSLRPFFILLIGTFGCATHFNNDQLSSIQLIDRNDFKETISTPERLKPYETSNFLSPQPYKKITRLYTRNAQGKTLSKLTTYHNNGELWQYLEVVNGRACGTYQEWHENGQLRLHINVMEGQGDISEEAQYSWIFDGPSYAMNDRGHIQAEIHYEKGQLQGLAKYFYPNGKIKEIIPYENNLINGDVFYYNNKEEIIGTIPYVQGKKHGLATFQGDEFQPAYQEKYENDLIIEAVYHDFSETIISSIKNGEGRQALFEKGKLRTIKEYKKGRLEGEIQNFNEEGNLESIYHVKEDKKHGEEWIYFSLHTGAPPRPKLYIQWKDGVIQGISRSWYCNGTLESEREIYNNCKHGMASAWYKDGSLMMIEEYENDQLCHGTYMKRGCSDGVSSVVNGEGLATLYDADGVFIKKIVYKEGRPVVDEI